MGLVYFCSTSNDYGSYIMTTPNPTPTTLREVLDYTRYEQEWIAMNAKDHKPKTKHEKDCGVCVKNRVLLDQATQSIQQQLKALLPERHKPNFYEDREFGMMCSTCVGEVSDGVCGCIDFNQAIDQIEKAIEEWTR